MPISTSGFITLDGGDSGNQVVLPKGSRTILVITIVSGTGLIRWSNGTEWVLSDGEVAGISGYESSYRSAPVDEVTVIANANSVIYIEVA